MGFTRKPDLLADFYFESHFSRGVVKLNSAMMRHFINVIDGKGFGRYFYARAYRLDELWALPAASINDQKKYDWLKRVMRKFG